MKTTNSIFKSKSRNFSLLCLLFLFDWSGAFAQEISGNLKFHTKQEIKLLGYNGFKTIELAKDTIDTSGNFSLAYKDYNGMGYIETLDQSQLFLVINDPQINITGTHLREPDSLTFTGSKENLIFNQFAKEHNQREKALAGWKYLLPQYKDVQLFNQQRDYTTIIQKEINRLEKQDLDFLNQIDKKNYVSWFLPLRKLLDDIPLSAQQYSQRIPQHIADLRQINYNDSRLYYSGILDDLLESHYWLIENSGLTLDSMYVQMNISTDKLIENLEGNDKILNEVSDFLFRFLEKRSLFKAAEYLAVKLLNNSSCTLDDDLAKQMETYRIMKVGNTAPDIVFEGKKMMMGSEVNKDLKLSDFNSDYTLVVFGSSWCPSCTQEIPKIKEKYIPWKLKGVETVLVSLDSDESEFNSFVEDFPFLAFCDFKGWENKAVQDYYVFATPTLFLLDKDRKIILRPRSIEQVDAWVNYKLDPKN